jgi:hypothetical protein
MYGKEDFMSDKGYLRHKEINLIKDRKKETLIEKVNDLTAERNKITKQILALEEKINSL